MKTQDPKHFETLGLQPGATPEVVKRAYLALVKRWHPDRVVNDPVQHKLAEERMRDINVAYEALQDAPRSASPFQRATPAPAGDSADATSRSGTTRKASQPAANAFAFWRGQTGGLSWVGTILLAGITLASFWFVVTVLAESYAPPYVADAIRYEAKQQSVIARTRRAAETGETWAMMNMGWYYYTGRGLGVDLAEAAQWFARAAEAGEANGQTQLGLQHAKGEGVVQDYAAAASWFRAGAEQGQRDAQHNLALLHRSGLGVPVDFAEAYQWWSLAAASGHATAAGLRDELVNHMTEQQIAEGQRRLQATARRLPKRK